MKFRLKFVLAFLVITSKSVAQSAPIAHFGATDTTVCDSTYTEGFTDQSTNNPTSWKWYFPGAIPDTSTLQNPTSIQYTGYGGYTVKLVVKNNYGSDSLTDSNYICLDAPPHIKLTGGLRTCATQVGGTDTIWASGGTQYHWSNGATTSYTTFPYPVMSYTLAVRVYNAACYSDTTFTVIVDTMPHYVLEGPRTICEGDSSTIYTVPSVGSALGCSLSWDNGSTADSLNIGPDTVGSYYYYVVVTNKYKTCPSDTVGITITVDNCTGVENYFNYYEFTVYPNPSNGVFTLQTVSEQPITNSYIQVYNVLGQQVYQSIITANSTKINLSGQPQGVYLYRIITQTGELVGEGKIVIRH